MNVIEIPFHVKISFGLKCKGWGVDLPANAIFKGVKLGKEGEDFLIFESDSNTNTEKRYFLASMLYGEHKYLKHLDTYLNPFFGETYVYECLDPKGYYNEFLGAFTNG